MDPDREGQPTIPLRLAVELRFEGTGIAGSVRDELGAERAFSGWLGLLSLLEVARIRTERASESVVRDHHKEEGST